MRRGQGRSAPIADARILAAAAAAAGLNRGQRAAVERAALSADRVVGVQGAAGAGKTTALRALARLAEACGRDVLGLAPSAAATKLIAQETGAPAMTLQRFLALRENGVRRDLSKTVLIVDEASMMSTGQMVDLLRLADKAKAARVVLVGDVKQLGAVEAGKPFDQLQKAGLATAIMDEISRQKDTRLREAVTDAMRGAVDAAFRKIDGDVREVSRGELGRATGERWLALSDAARAHGRRRAHQRTEGRDYARHPRRIAKRRQDRGGGARHRRSAACTLHY